MHWQPSPAEPGPFRPSIRRFAEYHNYAVQWEPGKIKWYLDRELFFTETVVFLHRWKESSYPAPFDQPFYIILNLAVGGDWPGSLM
ncbi:MAG: family 16 glycosylhydrolase [Dysosmobacter welbionis]